MIYAAQQGVGLLLSHAAERADALVAQKIEDADASQLPPVLSVRGRRHVSVVVEYLLEEGDPGSVGEEDVVGLEQKAGSLGRRDHQDRFASETEQHERPVASNQGLK